MFRSGSRLVVLRDFRLLLEGSFVGWSYIYIKSVFSTFSISSEQVAVHL